MQTIRSSDRSLRVATLVYLAAFVLHNADHARRGVDATPEPVVWAGTAVAMLTAVLATLVFTSHGLSSRFAAFAGAAIAIGVSITHLTPTSTVLTDPLTLSGISPMSWIAVLGEITTAAVLATVGWKTMQAETLRRQ